MKLHLLALVLIFSNCVKAETYYISSKSGDDSRKPKEAQNASTPWKTIGKLNNFYKSLKDGDVVLFKRGEVYYGSLQLSEKPNKKTPSLTFGAYGRGEKPVITGFQTISGWTSIGNGIYEKQSSFFPDTLNLVLFNGNLQPMGRWPKLQSPNEGYLTFQSHVDTSSITSTNLPSAKNFVGGEVVIRKTQWVIDRGLVTAQSQNKINYTPLTSPAHPNFTYEPIDNYGFFFQNHVNALTTLGDWCFDPTTKKVKMYFGSSNPDQFEVKIPGEEYLVDMSYANSIDFEDISFTGANSNAINILYSTNITINNCDITYSGMNGISVFNGYYDLHKNGKGKGNKHLVIPDGLSNNFRVTNSTITNINNNAINGGNSNTWTIQNNLIKNIGLIAGMGASGDGQYEGISYTNSNTLIEYNKIFNIGYIGIHFIGNNTTVKNNYVDSFCLVKSDGGGIYTYEETGTARKITGNIVSNGIGDQYGINADFNNPYAIQVHGIYMDGNSSNVSIEDNTVFNNSHSGLFFGSSTNMTAKNNLLYNNKVVQLKGIDSKGPLSNITINNNVVVARDSAQLAVSFVLVGLNNNPAYNIGSVDYNFYCRPLYEPSGVKTQGYPHVPTYFNYPNGGIAIAYDQLFYSLDGWQALTGWDLHTQKSPQTIHSLDSLRFEFNPTNVSKKISLNGTFVDMKNQLYNNSVVLPPYSSIVLIQKNVPVATQSTMSNSLTSDNNPGKFVITTLETTTIRAFPNPFSNTATVVVRSEASGESSVDLFNQEGRAIKNLYRGSMEAGATKTFNINSGQLAKGVYFIRFANKGRVMNKKITVE